jgi:uncharacterized protein YdeI (YjbR/CyaY-like superfamily)
MEPTFFATHEEFRAWLEAHHVTKTELLVGFHKKGTGRPSITWPESVDEALCYGWIDGVRKRLDDDRYTIRFTPRKPGSIWSAVNIQRVEVLTAQGLMRPAGLRAFLARDEERSRVYSYERAQAGLSAEDEVAIRANALAWTFFQAQPPSYRKTAAWWVVSAKREETRRKRLATLIADSELGRRIGAVTLRPRRGERRDTAAPWP